MCSVNSLAFVPLEIAEGSGLMLQFSIIHWKLPGFTSEEDILPNCFFKIFFFFFGHVCSVHAVSTFLNATAWYLKPKTQTSPSL